MAASEADGARVASVQRSLTLAGAGVGLHVSVGLVGMLLAVKVCGLAERLLCCIGLF